MHCLQGMLSVLIFLERCIPTALQLVNTSLASLFGDELSSEFRFQQLQLSTTMMNASFYMRLPEKLAAAEAREADEREAKATRAYYEAQTPFIATTSRLNLGYIGRGYDLFKGNPLSDDGVVDQGFRLPVMELPYTYKFTADGNHRIPDNVDVISESSAKFGSSLYTVQSESDYKSMLSVDASVKLRIDVLEDYQWESSAAIARSPRVSSRLFLMRLESKYIGSGLRRDHYVCKEATLSILHVNADGGGWGFSASFSASASYQKNSRVIQKGETSTLSIVSRAVVYRARMSETSKSSKVNDFFEKAVMLLPMENCESGALQNMYINLIREFGTHYTTEVVMGAKAVQQLTFSKSDLSKLESEGISTKVAAQASFSGFGASGGGGFSVGVNSKQEAFNRLQNTNKEQYAYYIGGNPPSGDFSSGSTESLQEWAKSADEKPVPIQYKMTSIDNLLKPGYFKNITYGLFERRHCLRSAIYAYCKQISSPSLCNPPDEASFSSRRKRQTVNGPGDGIKFGDFISLRNENSQKYLALSNSTGILQGTVTKPLVPVTTFSDYSGLFQIKSNDDDANTVGTPLEYGQVFKLVTVEGENLFLGRAFIDDVKKAQSNKLQDAFYLKDGRKYSSPGDLTGMSIFLKSEMDKPYLISLQIRCSYTTYNVQVNLEGDEGTVKFQMRHNCSYSNNWNHDAFSDKDIGELQRVHFMSTSGTEPIKGIQVRTSQNGRILRYQKTGIHCTGNEMMFTMDKKEEKPAEYDIYPTQFSLLSKNYPLGSFVRRRDTVFVEVVSAIKRKSFWGKPATHLLSHKNSTVTVEGKTPVPHKLISGCSEIIYPGNERLSVMTSVDGNYFVSFSVDVMIRTITIKTKKSYQASGYKVEYIDRNSSSFQQLTNFIRNPTSGYTASMELKFSNMYLAAVKVYIDGAADFPQNIGSFLISGCPAALVEEKQQDTRAEEWNLKLSENEIQTYPYLSVITTQYNVSNFDKIFENLERFFSVDNYRVVVPLMANKRGCMIDENYIQTYLMTTDEIEGLKFENTRLSSSQTTIIVTTSVTAMNKIMFDQNMPALESMIRMAVQQFTCNEGQTALFAYRQPSEESGMSSVAIAVISVLATIIAFLIVLGILAFVRYRRGKNVPPPSDSRPMVKENCYVDESDHTDVLYTNNAFDAPQDRLQAFPAIPSRSRRLT